ncbi:hypothetical protein Plhal304r1_c046g0127291 [Plasmopara halstedii]
MGFVRKPFGATIAAAVSLSLVAADPTVSILGDATYTIPSSRGKVCGDNASGKACPLKGDVAVENCNEGLPSYINGKCIAPSDAECILVAGTTLKCVFPMNEIFGNEITQYKTTTDEDLTSYVSSASASGYGDAEVTFPEEERLTLMHDLNHPELVETLTPNPFESNDNHVMQYPTENESQNFLSPLPYSPNVAEDHSLVDHSYPTPSYSNVNDNLIQKVFGLPSKLTNTDNQQHEQKHHKYKKGDRKRFTNENNDYGSKSRAKDTEVSNSNATPYSSKRNDGQIPSYQANEMYTSKSLRGNNDDNFGNFHQPNSRSDFFEIGRYKKESYRPTESKYSKAKAPIVKSFDHDVKAPCTTPPATTSAPTIAPPFPSIPATAPKATSASEDEVDLSPSTQPANSFYTSSPNNKYTTGPSPVPQSTLSPGVTSTSGSTYNPSDVPETTPAQEETSTPSTSTTAPDSSSHIDHNS